MATQSPRHMSQVIRGGPMSKSNFGSMVRSSQPKSIKLQPIPDAGNKSKSIPQNYTTLEDGDIQFANVCRQANVNVLNEPPIIVEAVRTFVKGALDEGWVIEEDQNGEIVYHFKPDNITTSIHPHLNRLKTSLIYLRQ